MNKKVLAIVAVIALVAILGVCLVACNAENYEKRLKDADYTTAVLKGEEAQDEADSDASIEWLVTGSKGLTDHVMIIKFKNTDDAKDFESSAVTGTALKLTCKRSGKIVIYGTEQAVKDAQ